MSNDEELTTSLSALNIHQESSKSIKGSPSPGYATPMQRRNSIKDKSRYVNSLNKARQFNVPDDEVVSEPGVPSWESLKEWIRWTSRFPTHTVNDKERDRQMDDKERWLARALFPKPDLANEGTVDRWFDTVARMVTRHAICIDLFVYLVAAALPEREGNLFETCDYGGYETRVQVFIRALFRSPKHVVQLENEILQPVRQLTVEVAHTRICIIVVMYVRACIRRGRTLMLSLERLQESCLGSLPIEVEKEMEMAHVPVDGWVSLDSLMEKASSIEEVLQKYKHIKSAPYGFPAALGDTHMQIEDPTWNNSTDVVPLAPRIPPYNKTDVVPPPCGACAGIHWMKDCPYKSHRCEKCHRLGHVQDVCRAYVMKTGDGRVDCYLVPRPGSVEFKMFRDRTQEARIQSASRVLQELLNITQRKSEKGKQKRKDEREEKQREERKHTRRMSYLAEVEDPIPTTQDKSVVTFLESGQ